MQGGTLSIEGPARVLSDTVIIPYPAPESTVKEPNAFQGPNIVYVPFPARFPLLSLKARLWYAQRSTGCSEIPGG
jgi:hypothetical protein